MKNIPSLDVPDLAELVAAKRLVCAFPINGTRRWYLLERLADEGDQADAFPRSESAYLRDYLLKIGRRQADLARLFFQEGVYALITPLFGQSLLARSREYVAATLQDGLGLLADDLAYITLFRELGVRVRFYGDYESQFAALGLHRLLAVLDGIMEATAGNVAHLWLLGLCADDPVEHVGRLTIQHHAERGTLPTKADLVGAYYGIPLERVDLFIGHDTPSVFDIPLLDMNQADLYFTVSPSPYLDADLLRAILFDHLWSRRLPEQDYVDLGPEDLEALRSFYEANRNGALGLGRRHDQGWFWYPTPQVKLPPEFEP